jgi:hypothetical protein
LPSNFAHCSKSLDRRIYLLMIYRFRLHYI